MVQYLWYKQGSFIGSVSKPKARFLDFCCSISFTHKHTTVFLSLAAILFDKWHLHSTAKNNLKVQGNIKSKTVMRQFFRTVCTVWKSSISNSSSPVQEPRVTEKDSSLNPPHHCLSTGSSLGLKNACTIPMAKMYTLASTMIFSFRSSSVEIKRESERGVRRL